MWLSITLMTETEYQDMHDLAVKLIVTKMHDLTHIEIMSC